MSADPLSNSERPFPERDSVPYAQAVEEPEVQLPKPRPRRKRLPAILFLLTCLSTFWAGSAGWLPTLYLMDAARHGNALPLRMAFLENWQNGLIFMGCLLAILMTHEMGHFLAAVRYRIPASLPFFLPLPISPLGTMGAVIGMDGKRADRKEIFDIGLAGPLAGLVVAIPIMWIGVQQLDCMGEAHGPFRLGTPLIVKFMLYLSPPEGYDASQGIWASQLNPYFMAGWAGMLVTGLNMLPVSQLDGGHVLYTLFGKKAHWMARGFMLLVLSSMLIDFIWGERRLIAWIIMTLLVLLIGPTHPPTRDDTVPLGWFRTALGYASLLIAPLCFNPYALS